MKIFKSILILLFYTSSINAQYTIHDYDYPNGAYLQDSNNELDFFTGTWEGVQNNKRYIFQFVKYIHNLNGILYSNNYYYRDDLYVKLKVIDLGTNHILYDDTTLNNISELKIYLYGMRNGNGTTFYNYIDETNCNLNINFNIHKLPSNPNQIKYCYFEYYWYKSDGCPYNNINDIPMFLPKQDLILTKQ